MLLSACGAFAFPSFEPFTSATASGGSSYSPGSALYHQTNAFGEGWALWSGNSGSSSAEVSVAAPSLVYSGFPSGFPAPPTAGASLPGDAVDLSGYSAALNFSRAISADPNNLAVNKIYASFLMQVPNIGNLAGAIYFGGFATNAGDQTLNLPSRQMKIYLAGNSGTAGSSTGYSVGIEYAGTSTSGIVYDGGGHTASSVLFVVVDYEFGINGGADVGRLWVNPAASTFGATTTPSASAVFSTTTASQQLFSAADFFLLARNGATLWGSLVVSDLRVGDTWAYVTGAPEIVTPLQNLTNAAGRTAIFTVGAVAGATNISPLVYAWQFDGTNLSDGGNVAGSSTSALTLNDVGATYAGTYSVVVSNSLTGVTNSGTLAVSGISIAGPSNEGVAPGGTVAFSVTANGAQPLTYQWQDNGVSLTNGASSTGTIFSGSQTASLTLANVSYADSGSLFDCIVTNAMNQSATSSNAALSVGDPLLISNPQSVSVNYGGTASFAVSVAGSQPITYQWQHGSVTVTNGLTCFGSTVSGATASNLVITGATYGDAGNYFVTVTNVHGAGLQSAPAALVVVNSTTATEMDEQNVKSFGATGNGATDDTAAFNSAVSAAEANGNNGVYVPMGKYVISSALTLSGIELLGKFEGGWPAATMPMPTLLIRQYTSPAVTLLNGSSIHGIAIEYDQASPTTTNAPAISLQANGLTIESVRILNPYDGVNYLESTQPGRARMADMLILNPVHNGILISKSYDFVQYRHIEVLCTGAMSTGAAFAFGRVDEGGYVGLTASNCATGFQFYWDTDTSPAGGYFTGSFAACSAINCGTVLSATGDHKIKIDGGDFTGLNYGATINGTNAEIIIVGGKWRANSNQAILATLAGNIIFNGNMFCRNAPASNPLVWIQNCTTVTVNKNQFLAGSTGLEVDNGVQRAVIYGNSFEDGGISNYITSGVTAISRNLFTASPPSGLTATPGNQQVSVSWVAPLGATSYNVERGGVSGGPYTIVANVSGTNYTDTGLTNGVTDYYVVTAFRGSSPSALSSQANATPQILPPAAPASLTATATNGEVILDWSPSSGATNYEVEESLVSGGPYTNIASVVGTNYTDTGLTNGTTYYFIVTAENVGGSSSNSVQVSATPQVQPPATPVGLTAFATNDQAILSWMPTANASSYEVKRALASGGPYAIIAEPSSPSWTDDIVANGTPYFYVVSAANEAGQSGNSSQVEVVPQLFPPLLVSLPGGNELTLSWPGAATNYSLYMTTNLAVPALWLPVTNVPVSNNGAFSVTLPLSATGQQFYRLTAP